MKKFTSKDGLLLFIVAMAKKQTLRDVFDTCDYIDRSYFSLDELNECINCLVVRTNIHESVDITPICAL